MDRLSLYGRILRELANEVLPQGQHLYDVDGRVLFEIRGGDGGVVANCISYVVTTKDGSYFKHTVEYSLEELNRLSVKGLTEYLEGKLKASSSELEKLVNDPAAVARARKEYEDRIKASAIPPFELDAT
jgi:hypothetical protein